MDPGYRIKSGTGPVRMTVRELIRGSLKIKRIIATEAHGKMKG
jgi:hypothetical protein